jgi:hypothetical protein
MNVNDLQRFKGWFESYTRSFSSGNEDDRENISLKVEHSYNVCRFIVPIAREETTDRALVLLAETVALFHDVGRFPQYAQYKTFRDSISVNHGKLGAGTLSEEKVLAGLPEEEREIILTAVRFHNAFSIPDLDNPVALFCLKLVRDADKIDIWRIFLEFYENGKDGLASAAGLGLPDIPEYSDEIVAAIHEKRTASLSSMKSLTDFILLQLSWIYDLNFKPSARILMEKGIIDRFLRFLPRTEDMIHVSRILGDYAREQLEKPASRFSGAGEKHL